MPKFPFKRWMRWIIHVQHNVVDTMVTSTMDRWKHGAFINIVWLVRDLPDLNMIWSHLSNAWIGGRVGGGQCR